MNSEFIEALKQFEQEKNLNPEEVTEALEQSLASAYRKNYKVPEEAEIRVAVDKETGHINVFQKDTPESKEEEKHPENFGRIAAQTAKQVILQRLRDVERESLYEEYSGREGDIITGIVQQSDPRYILISLGKVEALLPPNEQVRSERYRHGTRLKAYITEVRKTTKEPQIIVSRSHPGLLKRLFELEVPEITDGFVEINSVAREPGSRSKIAVSSKDENIDAVGACVGPRGSRVRMVVTELWGEKIDIVNYDEDITKFVANALSPAKVKNVTVAEEEHSAEVVVPDDQLSLAIGKEGQNARLAAKLTGWRIDIKSESQISEREEKSPSETEGANEADTEEQPAEGQIEDAKNVPEDKQESGVRNQESEVKTAPAQPKGKAGVPTDDSKESKSVGKEETAPEKEEQEEKTEEESEEEEQAQEDPPKE